METKRGQTVLSGPTRGRKARCVGLPVKLTQTFQKAGLPGRHELLMAQSRAAIPHLSHLVAHLQSSNIFADARHIRSLYSGLSHMFNSTRVVIKEDQVLRSTGRESLVWCRDAQRSRGVFEVHSQDDFNRRMTKGIATDERIASCPTTNGASFIYETYSYFGPCCLHSCRLASDGHLVRERERERDRERDRDIERERERETET